MSMKSWLLLSFLHIFALVRKLRQPKFFLHASFPRTKIFERTRILFFFVHRFLRIWIRILCVCATLHFHCMLIQKMYLFDVSARIESSCGLHRVCTFCTIRLSVFFINSRFMISLKGHLNKMKVHIILVYKKDVPMPINISRRIKWYNV